MPIAATPNQEDEVDRLYGLPADEFTAARDELAKRMRTEGRREDAAAIKALKKPNLPAWAINQLIRRHRADMRRLLDAGERLRSAHERLLSAGEQSELREAAEQERKLVAQLVGRTEPLLSEAGKPSPANLERVRNTLHAVATDEELRAEFEAARVVRDRKPVGLGPFEGAPPTEAVAATTQKEQQRAAARRHEQREARTRAERAAKALKSAEAALERAREDAERAREELRKRERSLELARREAESAEQALSAIEAPDR